MMRFRIWLGRRTWPQRLIIALVGALGLLLLTPTRPAGACGIGDMGCGVDQAMYNSMLIAARLLWTLNRLLLLVAYLLDIIRYEIIANLFLGPYTQLTALVGEVIVPVAIFAILLAILTVLLAPFTGMGSPFSIRQILVIVLIAPPLLLGMGTGLGELDNLRVSLADQFYAAAAGGGAGFVGSVAADAGDMSAPSYLYPASCPAAGSGPSSLLPRHTGGLESDRVLRPDELAAAYLYAGAADIHCDYAAGGQIAGLPAQWADATPGYAHADDIGDQEAGDRQLWKDALTSGIIRLFLGLFVSLLALVYYAAHLVFTLALVALWVSVPFGILFGMFQHDFGWAGEYFKSAFDTLKNSWITSFIIGLLTAGLIAAAQSGNANVFAGIATGTLVFLIFTFFNALGTLKGALGALTSIAGGMIGGGAQAMGSAMNMAGGAAMGLATGGASTAMGAMGGMAGVAGAAGRMGTVANAAARESGSRAYGIAAALGSTGAGMKVGEFARQIGVLRGPGGDAVLDAMRTGHASRTSTRAFNQRVRGSAKTGATLDQSRADAANLAAAKEAAKRQRQADLAAQRADTNQIEQIDQLRQGNVAQRGVAAARALPGVIGAGARAAGTAMAAAKRGMSAASADDLALVAIGALAAGGSAAGRTVSRGAYRAGEALTSGRRAVAKTTGAAARSVRRSVDPNDRFTAAWRMGEQGYLQRVEDPEQATPPEDARRGEFSNEDLRDQMRAGATVRFHEDRTASLWGGTPPEAAPAPAPAPEGEDVPVRDLGTAGGWVQRQADAPPAADTADALPADGEVPVRVIAPERPSLPPRRATDRPPTRPAPQPAEPAAELALAVPEATLAAMRAQRPPRPRRIRPAMPAPSGSRPARPDPSSYFLDVDPSKHFGD